MSDNFVPVTFFICLTIIGVVIMFLFGKPIEKSLPPPVPFSDTTETYIVHYGEFFKKKQACDSYYTISDSTLLVYNGSDSIVIKQPYTVGVYEKTRAIK